MMNLETQRGAKVIAVHLHAGYDPDAKLATQHLTDGGCYTVKATRIGRMSSTVEFQEIPNVEFNTVHFENIETVESYPWMKPDGTMLSGPEKHDLFLAFARTHTDQGA